MVSEKWDDIFIPLLIIGISLFFVHFSSFLFAEVISKTVTTKEDWNSAIEKSNIDIETSPGNVLLKKNPSLQNYYWTVKTISSPIDWYTSTIEHENVEYPTPSDSWVQTSTNDFSLGIKDNIDISNDEIKLPLAGINFIANDGEYGRVNTEPGEAYQCFRATSNGYITSVSVFLYNYSWWVSWSARVRIYASDRVTVLGEARTVDIPKGEFKWCNVSFPNIPVQKDQWYWIGVWERNIDWCYTRNQVEGEMWIYFGYPINRYIQTAVDARFSVNGVRYTEGNFISISQECNLTSWYKLEFHDYRPAGTSITYVTQSADTERGWTNEVPLGPDGLIQSPVKRLLRWKAYLSSD